MNTGHIALATGAGSAGNADINTATDKALMFRGAAAVAIPQGEFVLSDPLEFNLPAITNMAVTLHLGNVSATTLTGHPGSRTTSFIIASNFATAESMPTARKTAHRYMAARFATERAVFRKCASNASARCP